MPFKRLRQTSPIRGERAVAEVRRIRLGGLEQWVMIRGQDRRNPILVLLHGGPGFNSTRMLRLCNGALESKYTVVHWDQRGTGRSFDGSILRSTMNVEQFLSDLDELVDVLRERLHQDDVVLFGHSWGSALGVLYAARHPDKVAAYLGCGQIGNWAASEKAAYAFTVAEAKRQHNAKALRELEEIGPPPHTADQLMKQRTWSQLLEHQLSAATLLPMARAMLLVPEASVFDVRNINRGFRFSLDTMWSEVTKIDLAKRVPALEVPVFFLLGRLDRWVDPKVSQAYFDALSAPSKTLVWFENSRHEPFVDEPAAFNDAMMLQVLPALRKMGAVGPVRPVPDLRDSEAHAGG